MSDNNELRSGRWQGRHVGKDALRHRVWSTLECSGVALGDPWSAIPDFLGAPLAAQRLAQLPFWNSARVVKCNPDRGQGWVRLNALKEGKRVYTPVPELTAEFPFLLLDPERLVAEHVPLEKVMYSQGALKYGERVDFEDMEPMDVCVVGCVAVSRNGGRTGKGAGFADLEMGIFRQLELMPAGTPVVTTVHPFQIVADDDIVMQPHDTPLDWIITADQVIETRTPYPVPGPLEWDAVQADQFRTIPFLAALRAQLTS